MSGAIKIKFNHKVITFYSVLLLGVFNSVFRFYLLDTPFFYVIYLPQILMMVVVFIQFVSFLRKIKIKKRAIFLISMLLLALLVGLTYTNTVLQVLMGIYILVPLFYGYVMYPFFKSILTYKYFYNILLIIVILGVILNIFYILPWEGFSYFVNGKEIEGNRFWTSLGTRRLSGFGRSSFETAGYILFLAIIFMLKKSRLGLIWFLGGVAIYYTNTKGILLAYLIISILVFFWRYIPYVFKKVILIIIIIGNLILPISSSLFSITDISSYSFLRSFEMRLESSWPDAYNLITESGNLITGRGLGGIGVPQNIFEPESSHPGDNLFVYLFAIFGISALLLYLVIFIGIYNKKRTEIKVDKLFYILSLFVFVYGVTTNVIELPIMAICLGLVFRYWTDNKTCEVE